MMGQYTHDAPDRERAPRLDRWHKPDRGVLFVVTGPSGVGKSTLITRAMARIPGLAFSCSATTRAPRPGEIDGLHYHFLTAAAFAEKVATNAFLESATVYDRSYGTLRDPTVEALARGDSLILDIDVQGAAMVRQRMPEAVHVFVAPPSIAALEERLRARGTETEAVIRSRMEQVAQQVLEVRAFDYLVRNDDLETATAVFEGVLLAEMSRTSRRDRWAEDLCAEVAGSGLAGLRG